MGGRDRHNFLLLPPFDSSLSSPFGRRILQISFWTSKRRPQTLESSLFTPSARMPSEMSSDSTSWLAASFHLPIKLLSASTRWSRWGMVLSPVSFEFGSSSL